MLKILQDSSLRAALVLAATLGAVHSAQAASITFDLATYNYDGDYVGIDGPEGHATWPITSGGVTLTLSGSNSFDGNFHDESFTGAGIILYNGMDAFSVSFSSAVSITGYSIIHGSSGSLTFSGDSDSTGNSVSTGDHLLESPIGASPSATVQFYGGGKSYFWLKSITVETSSVPDSNPWAFQAFALFGMVALGHRYGRRSQAA